MIFNLFISHSLQAKQYQRTQFIETPDPGEDLFKTPEAKAYQSYNFSNPHLYAGRLNVELPPFEIKPGGINISESLTHNATGKNIDNYVSNVEVGLNLPEKDYGIYPYAYITKNDYFKNGYENVTNSMDARGNTAIISMKSTMGLNTY